MNKFLLCSLAVLCAFIGRAETIPADDILAFVRSRLPGDPVKLSGILKVKAKNGFTKSSIPAVMELDWGAKTPSAKYHIGDESLTITWQGDQPGYAFSNPKNKPSSDILGSGITWADLTFSVLWWPGSKLIDEGKKINRDCYIVDVPVPDSGNTMRLWIEKNMGMLLEARTRDARGRELSCLNIVSIKKMDGLWVAKDLKIEDRKTGSTTLLQISDLEWKNGPPAVDPETAEAFDPADSVNTFASDLYAVLAGNSDENLFFSPYSIASALAMTYGGARGETAAQINKVLHFGSQDATHPAFSYLRTTLNDIQAAGHVELSSASALWPQKDYAFLPDYLGLTEKYYGSEIHPVDYKSDASGAARRINTWTEEQTAGHIRDLIPEGILNARTRLVLANAIYFKGDWDAPYDSEATGPGPFTLNDGTQVEVPMMRQTGRFSVARNDTLQAIELPYAGKELSMLILLPNPGTPIEFVSHDELEFNTGRVDLQLPKFKLESSFRLDDMLAGMGMPMAFSAEADFSGMDGSRNLYIAAMLHKAFVEVNEEGTEAAAATGVTAALVSLPPQFVVNRPFLFLIRENLTGTILFVGRVTDPR